MIGQQIQAAELKNRAVMTPSVTQIISPYIDFSKIPADVLLTASERGSLVHHYCLEYYAKGFFMMVPDEIKGYYSSFIKWFDLMVDEVLLVEERLVDRDLMFSGQIDLLAKTKQGEVILVDLKTPLSLSRSWRIQLSLYNRLCVVNGYKPDRIGSLRLSPEGKIAKIDWYQDQAADLNIGLQCLNVFRYFNL